MGQVGNFNDFKNSFPTPDFRYFSRTLASDRYRCGVSRGLALLNSQTRFTGQRGSFIQVFGNSI